MKECFMCKTKGVISTDLQDTWIEELGRRNLIPYECPKCGDKWIGNNRNHMYSKDGDSVTINDDTIPTEEREKYLWDKYKLLHHRGLFALGVRDLEGENVIDLYIEDDENFYLQNSFHETWLKDLINISNKMEKKIKEELR